MAKKFIDESIITDPDLRELSAPAFQLWILMLAKADDFGILPAEPRELALLVSFQETERISKKSQENISVSIQSLIQEILDKNLGSKIEHEGRFYFLFKPETFDKINCHLVSKRSKSKYLNLSAKNCQEFLGNSCLVRKNIYKVDSINSLNKTKSKKISNTREAEKLDKSKFPKTSKVEKLDKPNKSTPSEPPERPTSTTLRVPPETPTSNTLTVRPEPPLSITVTVPPDIPAQVIAVMHRIGHTLELDGYKNVTDKHWRPKLIEWGNKIGFACVLSQAEKLEVWLTGKMHSGKGKLSATQRTVPYTQFFNNWLPRVDSQYHTTGDSMEIKPQSNGYHPDVVLISHETQPAEV